MYVGSVSCPFPPPTWADMNVNAFVLRRLANVQTARCDGLRPVGARLDVTLEYDAVQAHKCGDDNDQDRDNHSYNPRLPDVVQGINVVRYVRRQGTSLVRLTRSDKDVHSDTIGQVASLCVGV
jgi:hypothetical protein